MASVYIQDMGIYGIDSVDGNEICSGLSEEIARDVAQRHANCLGESVWLYEIGNSAPAEEVTPSEEEE